MVGNKNSKNMEEDKVYFQPGEIVTIRLEIPNKPIMIVVKKVTMIIKLKNTDNNLKGILCRWFTKDLTLQEAVFNTKDLIKL